MSNFWRKILKFLEVAVLVIGSILAIALVVLVIYGLHTDFPNTPGIYLKHCPIG